MATGEIKAVVTYLTGLFGLRGLNGLDFIWQEGHVWTIELNPRPSASLELLDLAYGLRVFDAHVLSFAGQLPHFELGQALVHGLAAGKAILYASHDVIVSDTADWVERGIRDIPHSGEQIKQRQPVCTILTTANTPATCLHQLRVQAADLKTWLKPIPQ